MTFKAEMNMLEIPYKMCIYDNISSTILIYTGSPLMIFQMSKYWEQSILFHNIFSCTQPMFFSHKQHRYIALDHVGFEIYFSMDICNFLKVATNLRYYQFMCART